MTTQNATRYELNGVTFYDARGNLRCEGVQSSDYVLYDDGVWQFRGDGQRMQLWKNTDVNKAIDLCNWFWPQMRR